MTTSTTTAIRIDIISDIVCPWCWLGWRYLKAAIDQTAIPVEMRWRAYMLDTNVPKNGTDYKAYMAKKFGTAPDNRFAKMREHLEAAAPDAGIEFRFDGIPKRANTLAAHQLMHWAQEQNTQEQNTQGQNNANDMAEALFTAFFKDHLDINDQDVLLNLASEFGMDTDLIRTLYSKNADETVIMEDIAAVSRAGIRSVPSYIYQGKYLLQGAQPAKAHYDMIEKLSSDTNST